MRGREEVVENLIEQHQAAIALNDREIASLILIGVVVLLVFLYPSTRGPAWGVVKSLAQPSILIPFLGLAAMVAGLVFLGQRIGLWESALAPPTAVWVLTQGLVLLYRIGRRKPGQAFFTPALRQMLNLSGVLDVFIGFYVFGLGVELFLLVVLAFLGALSAVAGSKESYRPAKNLVDTVLSIIGIALLLYVVIKFIWNIGDTDWAFIARAFFLPFGLTLGVMPYLFLVSIWAGYHDAFMWVRFETNDQAARRRAQLGLILAFGPRVAQLGAFRHYWVKQIAEAEDIVTAREVGRDFLRDQNRRATEKQEAADRLVRYTDVEGENEDGQRLDQREFQETKAALQWLATMQMGWYQNHGNRYRPELLDMLRPDGLGEVHGIHLNVSDDGQAWWGWRRTVTGWCFAIGASQPPPNQWLYDGADPPKGFPGQDPIWGDRWGTDAKNW